MVNATKSIGRLDYLIALSLAAAISVCGCREEGSSIATANKSEISLEAANTPEQAVANIKKLGGAVGFDRRKSDRPAIAVSFSRTNITDAGLVHLKELTNIETLYIWGHQVTDAGLVHLKGLTKLQKLSLNRCQLTDAGLVHLKELTNLQVLALSGTLVTDAGLVHLKGLTKLQRLDVSRSGVVDAGLVHLKGLTELTHLNLSRSQRCWSNFIPPRIQLTDTGLVHLTALTKLQELNVYWTDVTDDGVNELQQALPNCKIFARRTQ